MKAISTRFDQQHGVGAESLARVTVLSKTIIDLIGSGMAAHPLYAEDAVIGYEFYIRAGKTHFYNGEEITELDVSNFAAANIIMELPAVLSLPPTDPFEPVPNIRPPLTADKKNQWAQPTCNVLVNAGLYVSETWPAPELLLASPALCHYSMAALYPQEKVAEVRAARAKLPRDQEFNNPFRRMSRKAVKFVAELPTIEEEVMDVHDILDAVHKPYRDTIAPTDISDSSWSLADVTRDVPIRTERFGFYELVSVDNSAEYLGSLLADIEKLAERLQKNTYA